MPSVPVLQQGGVRESALPNVRVGAQTNVDAFGGGGENVTRAAQGVLDVVDRIRQQAEQTRIQEADNEAARVQNTMLYGDKEGNVTGVKDIQGKDALGITTKYSEEYKKSLADIEKSLASPAQRAAFRQKAELRYNSLNEQLNKHEAAESDKYATSVFKSGIQIARDDAVTNYHDPSKIQLSLLKQKELIKAEGERQGLDATSIDLQAKQLASKTHSDIIERMAMNGDDLAAEKYFNENKDNFVADDLVKNEKFVAENSRLGSAQRFTDDAFKKGMSMTSALAEARKIEDPKLREFTSKKIQEEFGLRKAAQDEDNRIRFEGYADLLESSKGDIDSIRRKPGYAALDLNEVKALEERAQQLRSGKNVATDYQKYTDVMALVSDPSTRDQALKISPMSLRPYLADREFNKFVDAQNAARKGGMSKDASLFKDSGDIVKNSLNNVGIDPGKNSNKKIVAQFNRVMQEQINNYTEINGAPPDKKEIQRIADEQLVQGKIKDNFLWFDKSIRTFQIESGQQLLVRYKDIPDSSKKRIKDYLDKKKIPSTPDNITKMFIDMNRKQNADQPT